MRRFVTETLCKSGVMSRSSEDIVYLRDIAKPQSHLKEELKTCIYWKSSSLENSFIHYLNGAHGDAISRGSALQA
jgi:hypothetical protein